MNFQLLKDFDKKAIQSLTSICKEKIPVITADAATGITSETEILGTNISSISVQQLITAANATKYYTSIVRAMLTASMHYSNILASFKIKWEVYVALKTEDAPKAPAIRDQDNDRKVIKWYLVFQDFLARTYGSRGLMIYVLREEKEVPTKANDPLGVDDTTGVLNSYFSASGFIDSELVKQLSHTGPIYKYDNATVLMILEKSARDTSVKFIIKAFSRKKDGRAAYLTVIANHTGDTKYREIHKK